MSTKRAISTWRVFALALACVVNVAAGRVATQDVSLWRGVYTAAQADRGKAAYALYCSRCHGDDLGRARAYPLAGERFMDHWEAHTLEHLFQRIRDSMPPDGIDTVDAGDKRDIVAYLLQQNGFPVGTTELSHDDAVLATLEITRNTGPGTAKTGSLVRATGCLALQDERDWTLVHATDPEKTALPAGGGAGQPPAQAATGTREIGLLNIFPSPAAHRGHTMMATGFLVKNDARDAINVVTLEMVAASCRP